MSLLADLNTILDKWSARSKRDFEDIGQYLERIRLLFADIVKAKDAYSDEIRLLHQEIIAAYEQASRRLAGRDVKGLLSFRDPLSLVLEALSYARIYIWIRRLEDEEFIQSHSKNMEELYDFERFAEQLGSRDSLSLLFVLRRVAFAEGDSRGRELKWMREHCLMVMGRFCETTSGALKR